MARGSVGRSRAGGFKAVSRAVVEKMGGHARKLEDWVLSRRRPSFSLSTPLQQFSISSLRVRFTTL